MTQPTAASELARYFDAIVELTRHRDPHELATALLQVLRTHIPAREVRLLVLSNYDRDTEFNGDNLGNAIVYDVLDVELDEMLLLTDDADLLRCVLTQTPVATGDTDNRRMVFPLFGAHHVWALLVFEGVQEAALPHELLIKLLRVYSNQTFMLSRSQLDPLTGLYNRQSFYERIRQVAQRTSAQRRSDDEGEFRGNCFALFDIDHFKQVNDMYGHLYGDEVLLLLARLMARSFRHEDLLFRYGGEEFAAVLINVDMESAERLLERFRRAVETYSFPRLEPKTVSIGFTALNVETDVDKVVMCADKALYYAKNNGRNLVCSYEKLIAEGKLQPVTVAEGDIELF
jgi:diguanylate cyclase (GGDEF)-like protein